MKETSKVFVIVSEITENAGFGDYRTALKLNCSAGDEVFPAFPTRKLAERFKGSLRNYGLSIKELSVLDDAARPEGDAQAPVAAMESDAAIDDLFVQIGNLSTTRLDGVQIDDNQEQMVEDYIDGFNQMVLQGMPPVKALFAMGQAFGLTLGYAIRCGLHPADGRKLLGMLIEQSKMSAEQVKIVTGETLQ